MCDKCVTIALPKPVWEAIDCFLCIAYASRIGLAHDPAVDQVGAKLRDILSSWDPDIFDYYIDRIREMCGVI